MYATISQSGPTGNGFYKRIDAYCANSDTLSKIEDNEAVYNYIKNVQDKHADELHKLNKSLVNQTQISQQLYRADDYNNNATSFYTAFIQYTLLMACLIFILGGLTLTGQLSTKGCLIISLCVIALFTIMLMLNIGSNMNRLKSDWNKFDWGSVNFSDAANMSS
jgi:hypothetical protein